MLQHLKTGTAACRQISLVILVASNRTRNTKNTGRRRELLKSVRSDGFIPRCLTWAIEVVDQTLERVTMTSETEAKTKTRSVEDITKKLSGAAEALQGLAKPAINAIAFILPLLIKYGRMAKELYGKLPQNVINFFIGFVFCFFGGLYPVLFAAIEAAEYGGLKTVSAAVSDLANEATIIIEESKKDDEVDADSDGKSDVDQIAAKEYVTRKIMLVLRKMNPEKVDKALNSMYTVWLAVAAVLTIEFARAISQALAIADFMRHPVDRFVAPTIKAAVPDDYDRWVPVVLGW
jgi:hypothetical protein